MRFIGEIFAILTFGIIVSGTLSQDVFVERYLDLVNFYFKLRQVSVLTQFTCFSPGK